MMETKQTLAECRSIRKFADRPVDREMLTELVRKVDLVSPGLSGHPPVILVICSDLEEVARRGSAHFLEYGYMMDTAWRQKT